VKLAASNLAWSPHHDQQAAEILHRAGARGVELTPTTYFPEPGRAAGRDIAALRACWHSSGLEVVAIQALLFGMPAPRLLGDTAAATWERIACMLRIAGDLGCPVAVLGAPSARRFGSLSPDLGRRELVDRLGVAARVAERCGTCLCLEPTARSYGGDFVHTVEQARELVEHVGCTGFGLQLDTGSAMLEGAEPEATFARHASALRHVHLSEPELRPIGSGELDLGAWCRSATASGYDGSLTLEYRRPENPDLELSVLDRSLRRVVSNLA
jgi:D-psicose/D-tagatose/L-ribulose 3-epimerase